MPRTHQKASKTSGARKDVTPESAAVISTSTKKKNKKRNSGKQLLDKK